MKNIIFKSESVGLEKHNVLKASHFLRTYIDHIRDVSEHDNYRESESFIRLLSDTSIRQKVEEMIHKKASQSLRYILVVGIGGSNLGSWAIYQALRGIFNKQTPKILFADTTNVVLIKQIINKIEESVKNPEEFLINVISKSGTTTETVAIFKIFYERFLATYGSAVRERVVVTTDEGSDLWQRATAMKIGVLAIPKRVGGRYSVFSSAGLFPLGAAGFNIETLITGAMHMRDTCMEYVWDKNPALHSACILYLYRKNDIRIHNSFFFNSELEVLGKWYRQLLAESIGKEKDAKGAKVHEGIVPTVSIGSTDLHSMAQLYFGGPRNTFTTFIYSDGYGGGIEVPGESEFAGIVDGIDGKDIKEVMGAIYKGVLETYRRNHLPFMEIWLPDISEFSMGQLLQMKMMEVMYLGKLLGVNAFDQPNVEEYKTITRELLSETAK